MAIHIRIWRTAITESSAEYTFACDVYAPDPDVKGRQRWELSEIGRALVDRATGQVSFTQSVERASFYEPRVAKKLAEAVRRGELPERCDYQA